MIFLRSALAIVFFSLLYGCGAAHIRPDIQLQDLSRYENILVQNVRVYSREDTAKSNTLLQEKLKGWESFSRGQLEEFANNSRYKLIESLEEGNGETLVVSLDVNVKYGNRALRWAVGFGAGNGGVDSILIVKDAKTGEEKYKAQANSDLAMGLTGGGIGKVLKKNIRKLINEFKISESNRTMHPTSE